MPENRSPTLIVEDDNITISGGGAPTHRLPFSEIAEIAVYKRDEITTDLICCDILTTDGWLRTAHEDMAGFDDAMFAFERLPGFVADWLETVVQPAFAENRMIAFRRAAGR